MGMENHPVSFSLHSHGSQREAAAGTLSPL
jgi:hypothetical protein